MTQAANRSTSPAVAPAPAQEYATLNGEPLRPHDLRALALLNYGHFTSMQVEDGRVRGLDLHFARLDAATRELFDQPLDVGHARACMRATIDAHAAEYGAAFSLRVTIFSRAMRRDRLEPATLDVLTTLSPASQPAERALRLKTFRYERVLPHIKHVGTFGQFHHRRLAQRDGFDDALFVDASDAVSEASVWNIGFSDGDSIVWPDAPALDGVSMQLLRDGLRARDFATRSARITRAHLGGFRSAFLTNSSRAVQPIAAIDEVEFQIDAALSARLEQCHARAPLLAI